MVSTGGLRLRSARQFRSGRQQLPHLGSAADNPTNIIKTTMRVATKLVSWATWAAMAALCLPFTPHVALAAGAAEAPRLTILDGEAAVVEGAQRYPAAEGLALPDRALIETGPAARLLRIEWPDEQVIDLGPDTRVMLSPPRTVGRDPTVAAIYLLQGWAKQSSPPKGAAQGLLTPTIELTGFTGTVVNHVSGNDYWLFVESGTASIVERGLEPPSRIVLRAGSAYARIGSSKGNVTPRPSAEALQRVPRAFRDPLPLRFSAVSARNVKRGAPMAPTYAQLQPWLGAEAPLRDGFVPRFDELLHDRAFRHELAAHLRDHREWQPVLYPPPPKPKPKPIPPPRAASWAAQH